MRMIKQLFLSLALGLMGIVACSAGGPPINITPTVVIATPPASCAANSPQGQPYSCQLSVSGGQSPYTWKVASGSLPAGLTLSSTGLISGTPTGFGSYTPGIEACDSETTPACSPIVIVDPDITPTVSGLPLSLLPINICATPSVTSTEPLTVVVGYPVEIWGNRFDSKTTVTFNPASGCTTCTNGPIAASPVTFYASMYTNSNTAYQVLYATLPSFMQPGTYMATITNSCGLTTTVSIDP